MNRQLVRTILVYCFSFLAVATGSAQTAPVNDNFADRIALSGDLPITTSGSNVGAKVELNETQPYGGGHSVWWSWTAPSDLAVQFDTIGSNFDTVLAVYEGSSLGSLNLLSSDDQSGGSNTSKLSFNAVAGHEYQIAVSGYGGSAGTIALHLKSLPQITSPLAAEVTIGSSFSYQIAANNNPSSYYAYGLPSGLSYNYYTGIISGTTYASVGTYLVTVYAYGGAPDYATVSATLTFSVTSSKPTITSSSSAFGVQGDPFQYQITATKTPTTFYAAYLPAGLSLDATSGLISGTPTGYGISYVQLSASNDLGTGPSSTLFLSIESSVPVINEASVSLTKGQSIYLALSATKNPTQYTADSLPPGVSFDPATGVFTGTPLISGGFPVSVSAENQFGTGYNTVYFSVYDAVSDSFAGRVPIKGNNVSLYITTANATEEPGEPQHAGVPGNGSIWFTWTAPESAQYQIGGNSGAIFAVYEGTKLSTLRAVADSNEIAYSSTGAVVFLAVAGHQYQIALDSPQGGESVAGTFTLGKFGRNTAEMLRVTVSLGGTVTSGFLGSSYREIGQQYAITATPAPGYIFAGWQGASSSIDPHLVFRMQEGMSLQALFQPSPFLAFRGQFVGLITSTVDSPTTSTMGIFRINLTAGGAFTGSVTYAGVTFPLRGVFSPDGTYTGTINRPNRWPVTVSLTLDATANMPLSGSISDDVSSASMSALRSNYDAKANPVSVAGAYTLSIITDSNNDIPTHGTGFGVARVSLSGAIRFVALLPDGAVVSQGSSLVDGPSWPLFATPYGGHGSLSGLVPFGDTGSSDFNGTLTWLRPPGLGENANMDGFVTTAAISGQSYAVPPPGTRLLSLASQAGNLDFQAQAAGSSVDATAVTYEDNATLLPSNRAVPVRKDGFDLTFYPGTGTFAGHFIDPATGARSRFAGVVLQRTNSGVGLFNSAGVLGNVSLAPTGSGTLSAGTVSSGSDTTSVGGSGVTLTVVGH